jgi:SAM-dependent methyltransferase
LITKDKKYMTAVNKEAADWNEEGGERWVDNIERLESMLSVLSTHLITAADPRSGERVLDIGCGGGVTSATIADRVGAGGFVTGADISEIILNVARQRYRGRDNLDFLTADAGVHEFTARSYDLITSRFGVMFFPDPQSAFKNIHSAGKPAGRIVFMCWRSLKDNPWMAAPVAAAFTVLPAPEKPDPDAPGPFSLADPTKIERVLTHAGFHNISITPVDEPVNLGAIEPAVAFLTKLGPAAEALRVASDADRAAAIAAMTATMAAHKSADGVVMPGAVWLVEASVS